MDSGWVQYIPIKYLPQIVGVLGTALLSLAGFMGKKLIDTIQEDRKSIKSDLAAVKDELATQRTNCLTTLQEQGQKQIELLEKMVEGQAHTSGLIEGFLKGVK